MFVTASLHKVRLCRHDFTYSHLFRWRFYLAFYLAANQSTFNREDQHKTDKNARIVLRSVAAHGVGSVGVKPLWTGSLLFIQATTNTNKPQRAKRSRSACPPRHDLPFPSVLFNRYDRCEEISRTSRRWAVKQGGNLINWNCAWCFQKNRCCFATFHGLRFQFNKSIYKTNAQ